MLYHGFDIFFLENKEINTLSEDFNAPLTCWLRVFTLIIFTIGDSDEIYNDSTFKA